MNVGVFRTTLPVLLLITSCGLYGCGNGDATHASNQPASKVNTTSWAPSANQRYTPQTKWFLMSANEIAKLGTEAKMPLFSGSHTRRVIARYATAVLSHAQYVSEWGSPARVKFNPHTFRLIDAWQGILGGKLFNINVYERNGRLKSFILADSYDGHVVNAVAFPKPVYWMRFTGRFVTFVVPFPTTGFYGAIDLVNGQRIINQETAMKMAGMWNTMGGQPSSVLGLTKSGGGASSEIPSVDYKPYYYVK